jgi:predicted ABC-type ATPase
MSFLFANGPSLSCSHRTQHQECKCERQRSLGFDRIETFMELYIIAGPNGAGKTTFAREFLPNYADCKNFVNADLIAQGMAPFSPETAAVRAGRTMLHEIRSFAERRVSFAFETTLSGRSYRTLCEN